MLFDLAVILSCCEPGLFVANDFGDVHRMIEHLAGEPIWTHQLPRMFEEIQPHLKRTFPQFFTKEFGERWEQLQAQLLTGEPKSVCGAFVAKAKADFGDSLEVPKMPRDDYSSQDPLTELSSMVHPSKIITIKL